jgi:hypothetical protein
MSRDQQYCDDCGEPIKDKNFYAITNLKADASSANKGESAILCLCCFKKQPSE